MVDISLANVAAVLRHAAEALETAAMDAALYRELLYQVETKYPGETRHDTALRYIRQAEECNSVAQAAQEPDRCLGERDPVNGDYDCGHMYGGEITCDDCKHGAYAAYGEPESGLDPRYPRDAQPDKQTKGNT